MADHSSKYTPLKLIPFVTPLKDCVETTSKSFSSIDTGLSGKEVSQFYESIISEPTLQTNKKLVPPKSTTKVQIKSSKNPPLPAVNLNSDSIFRFSQEGNIKQIQQCVIAGYSIDQQDAYGWTPLMCATCEGHSDVVEYLLKQGASPNIKCRQGLTPLDIATQKHNKIIINLLRTGIESGEIPTHSKNELPIEEKYCSSCKTSYNVPTVTHEGSITHLFNAKKTELSTFYHIPENNRGFQIMLRSGWDKNKGLGINAEGRKFPIKTVLKKDRACIGKHKEVAKVTHFNANDKNAVKTEKPISIRTVRERTLKKWERKKLDERNRRREINFRRQFN